MMAKLGFNTRANPARDLTEVRHSHIQGLGLFARVDIPRGTVWWHARPDDLLLVDRRQYETLTRSSRSPLSDQTIEAILVFAYYIPEFDALAVALDNSRFVNHSFEPNSGPPDPDNPVAAVALRDIAAGEEITENYLDYPPCPWANLRLSFMRDYLSGGRFGG